LGEEFDKTFDAIVNYNFSCGDAPSEHHQGLQVGPKAT